MHTLGPKVGILYLLGVIGDVRRDLGVSQASSRSLGDLPGKQKLVQDSVHLGASSQEAGVS